MAVITDNAEPVLVEKAVSTKAVPSYMRPTKTSARRQGPVIPKSGALKPKNLNSVRTVSNALQALKSATKVPAPKQDKPAESEALAIIKVCLFRYKRYDTNDPVKCSTSNQDQGEIHSK
jgi:hypothetical protein